MKSVLVDILPALYTQLEINLIGSQQLSPENPQHQRLPGNFALESQLMGNSPHPRSPPPQSSPENLADIYSIANLHKEWR
jgi:hypothetical protein